MTDTEQRKATVAGQTEALASMAGGGAGAAMAATAKRKGQRSAGSVAAQLLPPLVMGGIVVGFWYFVTYAVLDESRRFLLRPPHEVVQVGFLDGENFSEIMSGLWSSTRIAMIGLAISIVLGFLLATIMSQTKMLERAYLPLHGHAAGHPDPGDRAADLSSGGAPGEPIWDYPIVSVLNSRVIVCVIISLFPIIVNTLFGLQSAERGMHDLFSLHDANRFVRLRKLMFPAAMPAIFAGLRISAGLSVIGAIVGDFFFGRGEVGIGQLLRKYANQLQGEELLAAVFMSSALGVAVFLAFGWLQTLAIGKWHDSGGL